MNEILHNSTLPSASFSEISMSWLLVTAAGILIFSLIEAWLATLIVYGKVASLKKIFPATHNLIRSHVDYLMITTLLGITYFFCLHLNITLPNSIIVLLCIGAIYNPFGFFMMAIKPKAGQTESLWGKVSICIAFLPTTIGFSYAMLQVISVLIA